MKKNKTFFLILQSIFILIPVFLIVLPISAETINVSNPLGSQNLQDIIDKIINFIFVIALVLAPLMIVIAGFFYMTAAGNPVKITKAKTIITWTIVGLAIILFSKGLIAIINQILGVK